MHQVGVLAYGSLLDDPGDELEAAVVDRIDGVVTPFSVEFARSSSGRGGAPTLVPVDSGGSPVNATILVTAGHVTIDEARDMTYRRERGRVGDLSVTYHHYEGPATNRVRLPLLDIAGMQVIFTEIEANIPVEARTPHGLAAFAIESVGKAPVGKDGITYLKGVVDRGIATPLTSAYVEAVLRETGSPNLESSVKFLRSR